MAVSEVEPSRTSWSMEDPGVPIGRLLGYFTAYVLRSVASVIVGLAATGTHEARKGPDVP